MSDVRQIARKSTWGGHFLHLISRWTVVFFRLWLWSLPAWFAIGAVYGVFANRSHAGAMDALTFLAFSWIAGPVLSVLFAARFISSAFYSEDLMQPLWTLGLFMPGVSVLAGSLWSVFSAREINGLTFAALVAGFGALMRLAAGVVTPGGLF